MSRKRLEWEHPHKLMLLRLCGMQCVPLCLQHDQMTSLLRHEAGKTLSAGSSNSWLLSPAQ